MERGGRRPELVAEAVYPPLREGEKKRPSWPNEPAQVQVELFPKAKSLISLLCRLLTSLASALMPRLRTPQQHRLPLRRRPEVPRPPAAICPFGLEAARCQLACGRL